MARMKGAEGREESGEQKGVGIAKGWKRRKTARSGACTSARDERRECPRDKVREIAEAEKLRIEGRAVTKREFERKEERNLRGKEVGIRDSSCIPFSFQASLHVLFRLILFPFKTERINM